MAKLIFPEGCSLALKVRLAAAYAKVQLEISSSVTEEAKRSPITKCTVLETSEGTIFGANAISRYICREVPSLVGATPYEAALVDQWIEFCNEIDLPANAWVMPIRHSIPACPATVKKAKGDVRKVMSALNAHLLTRTFFVNERPTLADISVFFSFVELYRLVLDPGFRKEFKNLNRWFATMAHQPLVTALFGEIELCKKAQEPVYEAAAKPAAKEEKKPAPAKPTKAQKPAAKKEEDDEEAEEKKEKKKPVNPLDLLPPSKLVMDDWKRVYSNEETATVAVPWLFENFDAEGYSLWFCKYKYVPDAKMVFQAANLLGGFIQRLDPLRKYGFGSLVIFNETAPFEIEGLWLFRGTEIPKEMTNCDDSELYDFTRADPVKDKERITELLTWEFSSRKFNQGKIFK